MNSDELRIVTMGVGNTRTRLGLMQGKNLQDPQALLNTDLDGIVAAVEKLLETSPATPVVTASVNRKVSDQIIRRLEEIPGCEVFQIGEDIPVPLMHSLDDATTVGHDRLLCALGAYSRAGQACVVIDAGTAITVDFVDGEGTFHGGAIAPGLQMMLDAMHKGTAALPQISFEAPDPARGIFGKDTKHAMLLGVIASARGVARTLIDQYAEFYEAYPQVVATGGDAAFLFENDPLVEHVVPDLQLVGIYESARRTMLEGGDPDDADSMD